MPTFYHVNTEDVTHTHTPAPDPREGRKTGQGETGYYRRSVKHLPPETVMLWGEQGGGGSWLACV